MKIPLVDLKSQYRSIKKEIDHAIQDVILNTAFINGKYVREFEESFADVLDVKHCIGVGNGTDALFIAMKVLGIGVGDEVITPANSFIATSEAVTMTGARVVFVDVQEDSFTIDVAKVRDKITSRTKAIIPVHLYGQAVDMDPLLAIADEFKLYVIEDAAQAHLAEYKGMKVGGLGHIACFSFYPGKNLGAYGDAGALVTNYDDLAISARMLANHGRMSKFNHEFEGYNSRMDGLQGAILKTKLNHLPRWTELRREAASLYRKYLDGFDRIILPQEKDYAKHVYHLFVIKTHKRDGLRNYLEENNISTGVHYPLALPNLKAYEYLGHKPDDFPVASRLQEEILSLPMFPELSEKQIEYISQSIQEYPWSTN